MQQFMSVLRNGFNSYFYKLITSSNNNVLIKITSLLLKS